MRRRQNQRGGSDVPAICALVGVAMLAAGLGYVIPTYGPVGMTLTVPGGALVFYYFIKRRF